MLKYFFWTVLGYLSGGIMYSYLFPKLLMKKDVRENTIDNNPGAGNAFRKFGLPMGALCLLCEILKGAIPVYFAAKSLDTGNILFAAVIASPVFGHAFSPFFGFNGGKAIATSFGVLLGLISISSILLLLAASFVFFSYVIAIKPFSFRILFIYAVFLLLAVRLREASPVLLGSTLSSAVVCYKHKKGMIFKNFKLSLYVNELSRKK